MQEDQGLETSTIGLRFKVRDKHFKNGDLKLKCTAVIATIYWKSNEESVQGVRPQSALVSESRSSRNSGKYLQDEGDPNQNLLIQMAISLKICIFDPMLAKSKCVWQV